MLHVTDDAAAHLAVTVSDRGFKHLPPITADYSSSVKVYESSAARAPHIWLVAEAPENLNKPNGPKCEASIHLTLDDAQYLVEQIQYLIEHHYQGQGE